MQSAGHSAPAAWEPAASEGPQYVIGLKKERRRLGIQLRAFALLAGVDQLTVKRAETELCLLEREVFTQIQRALTKLEESTERARIWLSRSGRRFFRRGTDRPYDLRMMTGALMRRFEVTEGTVLKLLRECDGRWGAPWEPNVLREGVRQGAKMHACISGMNAARAARRAERLEGR